MAIRRRARTTLIALRSRLATFQGADSPFLVVYRPDQRSGPPAPTCLASEWCKETVNPAPMSFEQEILDLEKELQRAGGVPAKEPLRQFLKLVGAGGIVHMGNVDLCRAPPGAACVAGGRLAHTYMSRPLCSCCAALRPSAVPGIAPSSHAAVPRRPHQQMRAGGQVWHLAAAALPPGARRGRA